MGEQQHDELNKDSDPEPHGSECLTGSSKKQIPDKDMKTGLPRIKKNNIIGLETDNRLLDPFFYNKKYILNQSEQARSAKPGTSSRLGTITRKRIKE